MEFWSVGLHPKHILVVDDEPQITRVLRTSLSAHGYDIRVANDGETALEIMKDWSPDLVITDLAMPNMDGLEFLTKMRAEPAWQSIPVLMVSTEGTQAKVLEAVERGASGYVRKPFTAEQIKEKLVGLI